MDECPGMDAQRDAAALILAFIRHDDEGVRVVAGNLADAAATAVTLARMIAGHVDYDPDIADELAAEMQRRAGLA